MSTKLFLGIMVIVLLVAGYVAYDKYLTEEEAEPLTAEGISFACTDGSYFLAEFSPNFDRLNVVVDGVTVRSLPRTGQSEAIYEYRANEYTYVFAGEEARVLNSANGGDTTCTQPFDPNNAPFNFGDRGEGSGSEQPDTSLVVSESILGVWKSADDEKFVREFRKNGIAVDKYEGIEDTPGVWQAFTSESDFEAPFPLESGVVYLQMEMGAGQDEMFYYKILKLTPEELELAYLDRGNVLRFSYVGETE